MKDPQYLDDSFKGVCEELLQIFIKKHKDYGKDNILDTGQLGIAFRISDKLSRLRNLFIANKKPLNESIESTWLDIAVYAIIAVLHLRGWFQKLTLKK